MKALLAILIRLGLWLRYDITYTGLEKIKGRQTIIFLPNHPAEIDPVIILAKLWKGYRPHSVVLEDFYYGAGLHWLMKFIRAIPMPNMWTGTGSYKRLRVEKSFATIVHSLKQGGNVLIYPSGRLMHSGSENLRGVSGVYDIISKIPDVKIVLIRTTGLIGSSFSWVAHQSRPNPLECLYHGLIHLLTNFIIFMPRRKILVEFENASPELSACRDKMEFNQHLENWYNLRGEESISLVSYSIWKKQFFDLIPQQIQKGEDQAEISQEIHDKVVIELAQKIGCEEDEIHSDQQLERNLGLDSLAIAEIIAWLDEEYYVSDIDATDLHTVYDVMAAASGVIRHKTPLEPPKISKHWTKASPLRTLCNPDLESTLHLNFLWTCDKLKNEVAVADDVVGVLTYHQVKIRVLLFADVFSDFPDERIGVMLPASMMTTLIVFAILMAGKTPVMINWTLGDKNLHHVLEASQIRHILTSGKFLDKLDKFNIKLVEKHLVIMEDFAKKNITLGRKIKSFYRSKLKPHQLAKEFKLVSQTPDDIAVILFTSGSETVPKGVPLSHFNILSNISGSSRAVEAETNDSFYAILPPFHSFGFTITMIFPLIVGVKVVFYPNPLESRRIASNISLWKPTIICGTPTFIAGILNAASSGKLNSLRLVLVGAEKAPSELFKKVKAHCNAQVLEGYGITECSPVLTINRPGEKHTGVGKPIKGVELCIVDIDKNRTLGEEEQGIILVRGPNVFDGYLDRDSKDAFVEHAGKKWYITGDLGFLTIDNQLVISGRLKRFVKIAGEMISLPAMETALQEVYPGEDGEVAIALSYLEKEGERPEIFLFSTFDLARKEINETLSKAGFGNLARINHVIKIDAIPVLGTGKIDYLQLKNLLMPISSNN